MNTIKGTIDNIVVKFRDEQKKIEEMYKNENDVKKERVEPILKLPATPNSRLT